MSLILLCNVSCLTGTVARTVNKESELSREFDSCVLFFVLPLIVFLGLITISFINTVIKHTRTLARNSIDLNLLSARNIQLSPFSHIVRLLAFAAYQTSRAKSKRAGKVNYFICSALLSF